MKEIIKNMRLVYIKNKGFISGYFLYIFMIIISLSFSVLFNQINALYTVENLDIYQNYFNQEYIVIHDLKTKIMESDTIDISSQINGISYHAYCQDDVIYVDIESEYNESLVVYYDNETMEIIDFESYR